MLVYTKQDKTATFTAAAQAIAIPAIAVPDSDESHGSSSTVEEGAVLLGLGAEKFASHDHLLTSST